MEPAPDLQAGDGETEARRGGSVEELGSSPGLLSPCLRVHRPATCTAFLGRAIIRVQAVPKELGI